MSLEHLWAGWRSAYVSGVANTPPKGEGTSVFRQLLTSGAPDEETYILWRGPTCFAILNLFPYATGHLLVMPNRETGDLTDLTPDEHTELWATVVRAVTAVQTAYRPDGVNVGLNLGRPAGAGIPEHLHVHVVPRWSGDTNFMSSVAGVRVMPEAIGETWTKLRAAWP